MNDKNIAWPTVWVAASISIAVSVFLFTWLKSDIADLKADVREIRTLIFQIHFPNKAKQTAAMPNTSRDSP